MNIYNNIKETKMFNKAYIRACFHHKKRIRKKNYLRARKMILLSNLKYRKYKRGYRAIAKWNAKKLCKRVKNRIELF